MGEGGVSDLAILAWGAMLGSWVTSLWIMRKERPTRVEVASKAILDKLYAKVRFAERVAPEMRSTATIRITANDREYELSLASPLPTDPSQE